MYAAILIACINDICTVQASPAVIKTEKDCYATLASGIALFENSGAKVPVYKCVKLVEEKKDV